MGVLGLESDITSAAPMFNPRHDTNYSNSPIDPPLSSEPSSVRPSLASSQLPPPMHPAYPYPPYPGVPPTSPQYNSAPWPSATYPPPYPLGYPSSQQPPPGTGYPSPQHRLSAVGYLSEEHSPSTMVFPPPQNPRASGIYHYVHQSGGLGARQAHMRDQQRSRRKFPSKDEGVSGLLNALCCCCFNPGLDPHTEEYGPAVDL